MTKIFKKGDIVKYAKTSGSPYRDSQPMLFLKDGSCVDYSKSSLEKTKEELTQELINFSFLTSGATGNHFTNPDFLEPCDDKFKEKLNYKILNEISKMITGKQTEEVTYDNISKLYVGSLRESLNKALNMINKEEK